MRALWTTAEDAELARLRAQGATYEAIGAALGRPWSSVKTRSRQIGAAGAADRPWADSEVATLREMHGRGETHLVVAAALHRSRDSVAQKVRDLRLPRFRRPVADRFWEKVDRRGPNECWPWRGARDRKGYGAFMMTGEGVRKHRVTASRLAYELHNGPIPAGFAVMHRCDNPPCCNPAHLVTGTIADNNRDMVEKRRHWRHTPRT